jgi:hypothetical protein
MPRRISDEARTTFKEIKILVFIAAGGRFGADVEQVIRAIRPAKTAPKRKRGRSRKIKPRPDGYLFNQEGVMVVDLATRLLAANVRSSGSLCAEASILLVGGIEPPLGFLVDNLEDVVTVPLEDIFPLPPLIERTQKTGPGLWAIARVEEQFIALLDLPGLVRPEEIEAWQLLATDDADR